MKRRTFIKLASAAAVCPEIQVAEAAAPVGLVSGKAMHIHFFAADAATPELRSLSGSLADLEFLVGEGFISEDCARELTDIT